MYLHTLPRSRRSKNRRRNGRWIRCAILDRQWVAPNAKIGLYLLDDKRREVDRARDARGEPLALGPQTSINELSRVVDRFGSGLYRLVARDPAGHILARRDFVASWSTHDIDRRKYDPRTDIEALRGELEQQKRALAAMAAERDAAQAEVDVLKRTVAERDTEVAGLEDALARQGKALRRARKLYAEFKRDSPAPEPADECLTDERDTRRARSRRRRMAALRRQTAARAAPPDDTAERKPLLFGLEPETLEGFLELVAKTVRAHTRPGAAADAESEQTAAGEDGDKP